ncbi:hypothetical protein K466DRAFT_103006 [Polyporus arcularius HHB13444]|uniref:F-box domain-containing protein n=1 Tax=Polyporus arcularius HHB13444 TaxID=1314778 RepID=A0A5C3PFK8_9APHY|nr:hypothetical protein K466DRAFT_103006 [Polyporus arcularius HHB13444]
MACTAATFPAANVDVAALPIELLRLICGAADRHDFDSIALSSRTLNEIITPALYSSINLHSPYTIYAFARTLASPVAMKRDLASLVEHLSIRDPDAWAGMSAFPTKHLSVVGRRLADAVPRMRRLRSITCQIGISHTLQIFTTLVSCPLRYLRAIDIKLYYPFLSRAMRQADSEDPSLAVAVRGLKALRLDWSGTPPASYVSCMCSLLIDNHRTLQSLAIPHHAGVLKSVWRSIPSFPALEELEISPDVLSEPAFQDTSTIRRFSVPEWYTFDDIEIPTPALPNLQDVTCFSRQLETFLPEHTGHRRPISTVTLNHVTYEHTRSGGHYAVERRHLAHLWNSDIGPALRALRFSGASLLRLSIAVVELSVEALSDLAPLLKELEYLLIVLQDEPLGEENDDENMSSWAQVFSYMPRLHTFLLSDCALKTMSDGGPFEFAHDEDYQRRVLAVYDQHSSSLRRVAFTTEFEWDKKEDGWHPWGHVVAEREIDSDGGGEDEE